MDRTTRRWPRLLLAVVLAVAMLSGPVLAHENHDEHDGQEESGLSIWPFLAVFGSVVAGGSTVANYRFDVKRQLVPGMAAGGLAMAVVAGTVWLG